MNASRKDVPRTLGDLAERLADELDKIMQHSGNSHLASKSIDALTEEWASNGGASKGAALLRKARAHAGMINSSRESQTIHIHSMGELTEFKQELRRLARGDR